MAHRLPNVTISAGVVHMYWRTGNSCTDMFMENYDYHSVWGNCPGDGGNIGGKPQSYLNTSQDRNDCGGDRVPEEFRMCSDVTVGKKGMEIYNGKETDALSDKWPEMEPYGERDG